MRKGQYFASSALTLFLLTGFLPFLLLEGGCQKSQPEYKVVGFPKSFAGLAEKVNSAVVNISTETIVKVPGSPFRHFFGPEQEPFGDFFGHFFGETPNREMKQQSLGSGFIIDKEGHIITNNHVVAGAEEITVKLADGREFKAKVIGRDAKTDLALIKISSIFRNLPSLPLGDSDKMRVGDWVLAIGNPFGLGHTVTQGIISATGRVIGSGPYDNFLQTDAPINPGNSGGPLINLDGEVIGINSAIIASGQGIGFSIPSNMAKQIIQQLKEKGKVVRGWIGVSIQAVTPDIAKALGLKEARGALVSEVMAGGPAAEAGLKRGDVITSFDGREIKKMSDLPFTVAETPVGKSVPVQIIRDGKDVTLHMTISEMPEGRRQAAAEPQENLGMSVSNMTPQLRREFGIQDTTGVIIADVEPGSLADDAGLQPGDVIKEVNRKPVNNVKDYMAVMKKAGTGTPVLLLVKRGRQIFYVSIARP